MMSPAGALLEFLTQLNDEERRRFEGAIQLVRVARGDTIIGQGPGGTDVYFIDDGAFQVLIHSKNGKQVSIRMLGTGECFGELAALDALERSATVQAITDGRLVQVDGAVFKSIIETSPKAALWLSRRFAGQIRVLTERIFELSALNVRSRLYCELLRLGVQAGVSDNEAHIRPSPTHVELANRIGTHREGVTREVRALVRQGLINQMRREMVLCDVAELSRLVRNAIR